MADSILSQLVGWAPYVLISAGLAGLALLLSWSLSRIFPKWLKRTNFRGDTVALVGGLPILAVGTLAGWYVDTSHPGTPVFNRHDQATAFLVALVGFGIFGVIDDLWGDRTTGGFRGHFLRLIQKRQVTTGLVKAVGGGIVALVAGYFLGRWMLPSVDQVPLQQERSSALMAALSITLYGAFIALFANTLNLVDLRPGRCLSVGFIVTLTALPFAFQEVQQTILILLLCLTGILLVLLPFDRAAKIMLGDTGSNALGAGLGVCYVCISRRWEIAIGVVLLAAFQIWCEKHSLSRFIESKPLLRSIDRKIGVR